MYVADKLNKRAKDFYLLLLLFDFIPHYLDSRYGVGTDYFFTYVPTYKQIYNGTPPPMGAPYLNGLTGCVLILRVAGISLYLLLQALYFIRFKYILLYIICHVQKLY